MRVFTWRPLVETPGGVRFRVLKAQFGDGYSQTVGDGINNRTQSWNLTFRGSHEFIREIMAFLDEHGGALRFLWTPSGMDQYMYSCEGYDIINHVSETPNSKGVASLTCTFEQRF